MYLTESSCAHRQVTQVLSQLEGSDGYSYANRMSFRPGREDVLGQNETLSDHALQLFSLDENQVVLESRFGQRPRRHDPPVEMEEIADLHTPRPL